MPQIYHRAVVPEVLRVRLMHGYILKAPGAPRAARPRARRHPLAPAHGLWQAGLPCHPTCASLGGCFQRQRGDPPAAANETYEIRRGPGPRVGGDRGPAGPEPGRSKVTKASKTRPQHSGGPGRRGPPTRASDLCSFTPPAATDAGPLGEPCGARPVPQHRPRRMRTRT